MTDEMPLRPMLPVLRQPRQCAINIGSISLKGTQQQTAYPLFSPSKNPDREELSYGNTLEIAPSAQRLPTIYDKFF